MEWKFHRSAIAFQNVHFATRTPHHKIAIGTPDDVIGRVPPVPVQRTLELTIKVYQQDGEGMCLAHHKVTFVIET